MLWYGLVSQRGPPLCCRNPNGGHHPLWIPTTLIFLRIICPPSIIQAAKSITKKIYFTDLGSQRCVNNDSLAFLKIICHCLTTFTDRLFSFCLMGEFLASSTFLWLSPFPENPYRTSRASTNLKRESDPLSHQHQ